MTASIPALLQPLKDRLAAATAGDANFVSLAVTELHVRADQANLIAAIEAVDRVCADWAKLADGDKYYAAKIRAALTQALGGG